MVIVISIYGHNDASKTKKALVLSHKTLMEDYPSSLQFTMLGYVDVRFLCISKGSITYQPYTFMIEL